MNSSSEVGRFGAEKGVVDVASERTRRRPKATRNFDDAVKLGHLVADGAVAALLSSRSTCFSRAMLHHSSPQNRYIYIRDIYSYARSSGFSQNWEFSFSPCKVHPATNQSKKSHTEYVPALLWWSEHHSTRVDGHVLIPTRPTNPAFRLGLLRCGSSGGHQLMQIHAVWCATAPAGREVLEGASTRLQLGSGGVFKGVLKD